MNKFEWKQRNKTKKTEPILQGSARSVPHHHPTHPIASPTQAWWWQVKRLSYLEGVKAGNYSSIFNLATFGGVSEFAFFIRARARSSLVLPADFQCQPLCVSHWGNVQGHDESYSGFCPFLLSDGINPRLNDPKTTPVKTPACKSEGNEFLTEV